MPRQLNIRLRTLLIILVGIALTPGMVVVIYAWTIAQHDVRQRAAADIAMVSKLVADDAERRIDSAQSMLATVASGPSVRRNDMRPICNEFLTNLLQSSPKYLRIGFADLNGVVQCEARSPGFTTIAPPRMEPASHQPAFFAAMRQPYFSPTGKHALDFQMAVRNDAGASVGRAFLTVDLDQISRQLPAFAMNQSVGISVRQANGVILAEYTNRQDASAVPAHHPEVPAGTPGPFDSAFGRSTARHGWFVATRLVRNTGTDPWLVTVSMPEHEALAGSRSHFEKQVLFIIAASLAGFLLAVLFARHFLEAPVDQLIGRMRRVQGGARFEAGPHATNAEFAEFEEVFRQLLESLDTKQRALLIAQEITRVGFFELDLQSGLSTGPAITYEILGLDPAAGPLPLEQYQALIHPDDRAKVGAHRAIALAGGPAFHMQHRIVRPDHLVRWIDSYGFVSRDADGKAVTYYGALQDITDLKRAEFEALATEKRFRLLFENSRDGVLQETLEGDVLVVNAAACKIFGLSEAEIESRGHTGLLDPQDQRIGHFLKTRDASGHANGQLTMVRGNGEKFEAEVSSSIYADATGSMCASVVVRDITERITQEKQIRDLAYFDALTGLPNRRLLLDRLEIQVAATARHCEVGAVMFVDLDNFKNLNDARGHATGDALLKLFAQRLTALMRTEDTVARLGGDEFVIILPRLASDRAIGASHALVAAEKVHEVLTEPFLIDGHTYNAAGSIGVTLFSGIGQTIADLLREADTAMYRAKKAGRNRIIFYETSMQFEAEQRLDIENDLAQAIGTDQLHMVMQPQVDCSGKPIGCELLMRWNHPLHGSIAPDVFIPVAEESGLILRMGDWVVREGCKTILQLRMAGSPMPVSINVSPRQFKHADFVATVEKILTQSGAPASSLIFEITEGLLIDNVDEVITRMNKLIDLGIRFSIDDFGTGYSSLSYLQRLPLYELKIDRSFILNTPTDPGPTALVQSILSMSSHLGLRVVAEGVETPEQAAFLVRSGCESMQGYLFAKPVAVDAWLATRRESVASR